MLRYILLIFSVLFTEISLAQLVVGRDTTVLVKENNKRLAMAWANGVNSSNVSNMDLNFDSVKDLVVFDKPTGFGPGQFRCFINIGSPGQTKYIFDPDMSARFPSASYWAICLDYNCDGKEDIFCSANGGVTIYKNTSTSTTGISFSLVNTIIQTNYTPSSSVGITPLYASSIGVPGIADIDNDGDLDMFTFAAGGFFIEYHKNMSKEHGFNCDSLDYEIGDACWGKIMEDQGIFHFNYCSPKPGPTNMEPFLKISDKRHAGSCLTCIDGDNDGDLDIIMGDIYCHTLQYGYNSGTPTNALLSDTTKIYPNYPSIGNTQQVKMSSFPCSYRADCDGDGKKDLLATPNIYGSENTNSIWYYKNTSTTNTVNFQFVKNNFLQDEMIDVGQNSYPVIFDYDNDGKKDLLVGTWGYFAVMDTLRSKFTLYRNIGTTSQPSYSLITRDYANIASRKLNAAVPTVGDIDNDGDIDICIGTSSGQIHWLENTAGAGNVCNFSIFKNNPFSFTTNSAAAAPQLFDINKDGLLDLMIGGKNGQIAYYKNTGTASVPAYSLITNFFGSIDVKGNSQVFSIDGYATPHFYSVNSSTTKLLVGNVAGQIFHYDVPSPSAILTTSCNLINANANNINEGGQSTIYFEDVNNDGKRDLFVGNGSGGLSFFSSINQFVGVEENYPTTINDHVSLYPNPINDNLNIAISGIEFETGKLTLYDLLGKEVESLEIISNTQAFLVDKLTSGVYFAKIALTHNAQTVSVTKKIIIN